MFVAVVVVLGAPGRLRAGGRLPACQASMQTLLHSARLNRTRFYCTHMCMGREGGCGPKLAPSCCTRDHHCYLFPPGAAPVMSRVVEAPAAPMVMGDDGLESPPACPMPATPRTGGSMTWPQMAFACKFVDHCWLTPSAKPSRSRGRVRFRARRGVCAGVWAVRWGAGATRARL